MPSRDDAERPARTSKIHLVTRIVVLNHILLCETTVANAFDNSWIGRIPVRTLRKSCWYSYGGFRLIPDCVARFPITTGRHNKLIRRHALLIGIRRRAVVIIIVGTLKERCGITTRSGESFQLVAKSEDTGLHVLKNHFDLVFFLEAHRVGQQGCRGRHCQWKEIRCHYAMGRLLLRERRWKEAKAKAKAPMNNESRISGRMGY
mmetsp:Transcript_9290/g.20090  ORF Transcript_9290/g.20090 Transcript_9290/m.20090 type:complete len:204 (+) Transcript_9290:1508-2119(+)